MRKDLILASKSPFRAQLLAHAGLEVEISAANINERVIEADFTGQRDFTQQSGDFAQQLAQKLAATKALEVSTRFHEAVIIGCDQILEFNGQILHKVNNEEEAVERLRCLSGKTHTLYSAFCLAQNGKVLSTAYDKAEMTMRKLSKETICLYLQKAEKSVLRTVGVYQIEGRGIRLFETIKGDYWTIIGLPLLPLLRQLRELGLIED